MSSKKQGKHFWNRVYKVLALAQKRIVRNHFFEFSTDYIESCYEKIKEERWDSTTVARCKMRSAIGQSLAFEAFLVNLVRTTVSLNSTALMCYTLYVISANVLIRRGRQLVRILVIPVQSARVYCRCKQLNEYESWERMMKYPSTNWHIIR